MAFGADAVVLIAPADAGPSVDPTTYFHPNWILWTPASVDSGSNRLLSLLTSIDWIVPGHRGAPVRAGDAWTLPQARNLDRLGYFRLKRRHNVVCLANPRGAVSPDALLLAADGVGSVAPQPWSSTFAPDWLVAYEAHDWDEVAAIAAKCHRTIVLEYPPRSGRDSSRAWIFERGRRIDLRDGRAILVIDQDTGIPGVFCSRRFLDVLTDGLPTQARPADRLEDANRWLDAIRGARPWALGLWGALGAVGIVLAAVAIMREKRSGAASGLLVAAFMIVPAIVSGCALASRTSISGAAMFVIVIWLAASAMIIGVTAIAGEKFETHKVIGMCAVVAIVLMALSTPSESILSGVFERLPRGFSPEAVGVFWGAVILQSAWIRAISMQLVLIAVLAIGYFAHGWWIDPPGAAWLAVGLAAMQFDRSPTWFVAPLALLGSFATPNVSDELWNPHHFERFFISPAFWSTLLLTAFTALFGDRFFVHQVRVIMREREAFRRIGKGSLMAIAFGFTHAEWGHSSLVAGAIGFGSILFACVRDL